MSQAALRRTTVDEPDVGLVLREPQDEGVPGRRFAALSSAKKALGLILVAKALVFVFVWLGYQGLELATAVYEGNPHFQEPSEYGLLTRFTTWDSSHYLILARDGYYDRLHMSNAFAPALPLVTRAVGELTGDYVIAGLVVSNAASLAALWLLWSLVRRRWGERVAWRTLVLLLAFPTGFFLSMVYTESIFLLLAVATFWGVGQPASGRWGLAIAAAAAFLLPLTRWIGVVVAAPLALWWAIDRVRRRDGGVLRQAQVLREPEDERTRGWSFESLRMSGGVISLVVVVAPIAGAAAYLATMQLATGDALAHVHAARLYPARWEVTTLLQPWQLWETTFGQGLKLHGQMDSAVDRVLFVVFVASAPLVYRRVGLPLFAFYVLMGMQPLMGSYMSYARYLLLAFPLFIAWGAYFEEHPRAMAPLVTVMVLMQAMSVMAHTSSRWVA